MITNKNFLSVRLSAIAERDFQDILRWTAEQFGRMQARIYAQTISHALQALSAGPHAKNVVRRDDIMPALLLLHVARSGRRGRHFILFRIGTNDTEKYVDVLRLLHDAMDFVRHLPTE